MSFIGKNIKKIRGVKQLSQQAFADIFGLKRGTLGAYEEGRSEPKIDTIIRIANHFSISIDDLLLEEMTVNSLANFQDHFMKSSAKVHASQLEGITYVSQKDFMTYCSSYTDKVYVKNLPTIHIPITETKGQRAFEVVNLEMTCQDRGFYPGDIVIASKVRQSDIKRIAHQSLVVCVSNLQIIFRRCTFMDDYLILKADHKATFDIQLPIAQVSEMWLVNAVFCNRIPEFRSDIEDQLMLLQQQVHLMNTKLLK